MGREKATIAIGDETLATRAARVLTLVCDPVIEVGPGVTTLRAVHEHPAGSGPLAAFLEGCAALGAAGPVFLLGCDLPFVEPTTLAALADWPGTGSIVPMVDGRAQYVCARWSAAAIATGRAAFAAGELSLQVLATVDAQLIEEAAHARELVDVDTPDDLRRLGLS
jgi:molybdopterin-guanine dinucleotide biosynthesis protein A